VRASVEDRLAIPVRARARSLGALTAAVAVLGLLIVAEAAGAAASINVSPASVPAGGNLTVSGSTGGGCAPGGTVTLTSSGFSHQHDFAGVPAIFVKSASNGSYSVTTQIPSNRAPGSYQISGRCGGGNFGQQASFQVTGASGTLPRTGAAAWLVAALGLCLLGGGVALRRRLSTS
jgi:LPXTG-motif cell wall-anchored protein